MIDNVNYIKKRKVFVSKENGINSLTFFFLNNLMTFNLINLYICVL